ncbi:hypothetical protein DTO027B3_7807 [Paecilomyces variotii]|nr:hypothetical protein DTO027B3_7807 [Paecilomyces variotii]
MQGTAGKTECRIDSSPVSSLLGLLIILFTLNGGIGPGYRCEGRKRAPGDQRDLSNSPKRSISETKSSFHVIDLPAQRLGDTHGLKRPATGWGREGGSQTGRLPRFAPESAAAHPGLIVCGKGGPRENGEWGSLLYHTLAASWQQTCTNHRIITSYCIKDFRSSSDRRYNFPQTIGA